LGQTGVIGNSKDYYLLVIVSQIFVKKQNPKTCSFCPKTNPQNTQTVFESSVMDIYDKYNGENALKCEILIIMIKIMQLFQFSAIFQ
jgi:hypothetical protein